MKLGVGVNIFSGIEFLKPSLINLRKCVDYIVGIYDPVSLTGEEAPSYYIPLLNLLKEEKLFDVLIENEFTPITKFTGSDCCIRIQQLKRKKYERARCVALQKKCSHFLGIDTDEFYDERQLNNIKGLIEKSNYDVTICCLFDYVHSPLYRSKDVSKLHVPFIFKCDLPFNGFSYPVLVDYSRTVKAKNFHIFNKDDVIMHHMTGVRYNKLEMKRKFQGHSHFNGSGEKDKKAFLEFVNSVNELKYDKVEDKFGILKYWKDEFTPFYNKYMMV